MYKNGRDYIWVIWKDPISRQRFTIGEISRNGKYEFEYTKDIKKAIDNGFEPIVCFPNLDEKYTHTELFPVFSSRLPDKRRRDLNKILEKYSLTTYDAFELLKRSEGKLPIDNFEFIDPILDLDSEEITRDFFIAGVRYYDLCNSDKCIKSISLSIGDKLVLKPEPENPRDKNAIIIYSANNDLLGYVPKYHSEILTKAIEIGKTVDCNVYSINTNENSCNECIRVEVRIKK